MKKGIILFMLFSFLISLFSVFVLSAIPEGTLEKYGFISNFQNFYRSDNYYSMNGKAVFDVYFEDYVVGSRFYFFDVPISDSDVTCNAQTKRCRLITMISRNDPFNTLIVMKKPDNSENYIRDARTIKPDIDKPSIESYLHSATIMSSSSNNLTFSFKTFQDLKVAGQFISYLVINDEPILVNFSSTNFDVKIPYSIYDNFDEVVSFYVIDDFGNPSSRGIFSLTKDNNPPTLIVGSATINDISSFQNGNNPEFLLLSPETFTFSVCVEDESGVASTAYADFSLVAGDVNYGRTSGNCVLATDNFCSGGYRCTWNNMMIAPTALDCATGSCGGKSFSINVSDINGVSQKIQFSIYSGFFNNQPSNSIPGGISITNSKATVKFIDSTKFYFYSNDRNTLFMTFPTNMTYVTASGANIIRKEAKDLLVPLTFVSLTQDKEATFALYNFTFNNNCGTDCTILFKYRNSLGRESEEKFDFAKYVDTVSPLLTDVRYSFSNDSTQSRLSLFNGTIYVSPSSIGLFNIIFTESASGIDQNNSKIIINNVDYPATKCNANSCIFSDVLNSGLGTLVNGGTIDMNICDYSGNCLVGNMMNAFGVVVLYDEVEPSVSSDDVETAIIYNSNNGFISDGDQILFLFNATDSQSGVSYATIILNDTQGNYMCGGTKTLRFDCVNISHNKYSCVTSNPCVVSTSKYSLWDLPISVFDSAGNVKEIHTNVTIYSQDSSKSFDCLESYAVDSNAAPNVGLSAISKVVYAPMLMMTSVIMPADLKIRLKSTNNCQATNSDNLKIFVRYDKLLCEQNILFNDEEATFISNTPDVYPKTFVIGKNGEFSFSFQLPMVDKKTRQTILNSKKNLASLEVKCNMTVALAKTTSAGATIYSDEQVAVNLNYTFVRKGADLEIQGYYTPEQINEYVDSAFRSDSSWQDSGIFFGASDVHDIQGLKKAVGGDFGASIGNIETAIEWAGFYCEIGNTIKYVNSIILDVGAVINIWDGGTGSIFLTAGHKIGQWVTGQKEVPGGAALAYWNGGRVPWGWSGAGSLGGLACAMSTCGNVGSDGGFKLPLNGGVIGPALGNNPICKIAKGEYAGAVANGSWTVDPGWMQRTGGISNPGGQTTGDQMSDLAKDIDGMSTSSFARSNYVASVSCLCLPGILYHMNKQRQMKCELGYCLQNLTLGGAYSPQLCVAKYQADNCRNGLGASLFDSMWGGTVGPLFSNLKMALTSPAASALAGFKDGATCYDDVKGIPKIPDYNTRFKKMTGVDLTGKGYTADWTGVLTVKKGLEDSANFMKSGAGLVVDTIFCVPAANVPNMFTNGLAAAGSTLSVALEVWEATVYFENKDLNTAYFARNQEMLQQDWCDLFLGEEENSVINSGSNDEEEEPESTGGDDIW
ncbi:MAG: hypothetical protein WC755_05350 [Candidatus Woesearchaeota archaeon]|jgi:hypothetical protein